MTQAEITVEQKWTEHPAVHWIRSRNPDIDPLRLLEELSKLLGELEDRFPGRSFEQIFDLASSPAPDFEREQLRTQLSSCGVPQGAIDIVAPKPKASAGGADNERWAGYEHQAELCRLNVPAKQLVKDHGVGRTYAFRAVFLRQPLSDEHWGYGLRGINGESFVTLAIESGKSASTCRRWARAVRYQMEEAERQEEVYA